MILNATVSILTWDNWDYLTINIFFLHNSGIRVQLDATINLKFETKIDNRVSNHKKFEGILKDASEPGNGYYIESPIREQLHGTVEGSTDEFNNLNQ